MRPSGVRDMIRLRAASSFCSPLVISVAIVPGPIARARWWATLVDPFARVVFDGVRTRGSAGNGRVEWYGATDQHRLTRAAAEQAGRELGDLADVWPPVRFGFSSTPRAPSVASVTTTIRL